MKLIRMLTGSKKSKKNQENKKPSLSKTRMQSLIIKDNSQLQTLNENLLKILQHAKSELFSSPLQETRNQEMTLIDKLVHEDPEIQNKYYEKAEVVKMIDITTDHLRKQETDLKNSVCKFKSNLEKYREVLKEREEMIVKLGEDVLDTRGEFYSLGREIQRDSDRIEDAIKQKAPLGELPLLDNFQEQYDDGLFKELNEKDKIKFLLILENKLMDQFFAEISKEGKKTLTCRNCKEYFDKESNHMKACLKHTGQLKYEPCLKCKKIELFTCCGYCESCCFGCTPFEHISIV